MDPTILSMIGVGVVLAALILNGQRAIRTEIASIRTEVRTEIASVRTEIASIRTEIRTEIAGVRTEIASVQTGLRTEIRTEVAAIRADIRSLSDRVAHLEGAFTILAPAALPALPKKTERPA